MSETNENKTKEPGGTFLVDHSRRCRGVFCDMKHAKGSQPNHGRKAECFLNTFFCTQDAEESRREEYVFLCDKKSSRVTVIVITSFVKNQANNLKQSEEFRCDKLCKESKILRWLVCGLFSLSPSAKYKHKSL